MQYTLRNIPPYLDDALRQRANDQGKSLNEVAVEILLEGLGMTGKPVKRRDLGDVAGTWETDPEMDAALLEQRQIDPDLWR